jgi:hypothetical protein
MEDFRKYEQMKGEGASPRDVCSVARGDGVDEITLIRLLRKIFGLSLRDVKEVTGAAQVLVRQQEVRPGGLVFWEGWSSHEGAYLMQARVKEIVGKSASLEEHRKFRVSRNGLEETPVDGPRAAALDVSYLGRPLSDRLEEALQFLDQFSGSRPLSSRGPDKKAV